MKRDSTLWPRAAATLILGYLLTVLSTTAFAWWAVGPLRLQPLLPVVVAAGFRLPAGVGGLVVLALGYLADLVSGGVVGLQLGAYVAVFAVCQIAQRELDINSWFLQMAAVGLMSLLFQLLVMGGLVLVHRGELMPQNLTWVLGAQAALTALTAPLFMAMWEALAGGLARMAPRGEKRRS
jgi:cell shape-determining protein MreD